MLKVPKMDFPIILLHLTIMCTVEFIYTYCVCLMEILYHGDCCKALEMTHVGSMYTTEIGKH